MLILFFLSQFFFTYNNYLAFYRFFFVSFLFPSKNPQRYSKKIKIAIIMVHIKKISIFYLRTVLIKILPLNTLRFYCLIIFASPGQQSQRALMINYSEFDHVQYSHLYFELLHLEPMNDFANPHFSALNEQANSSTHDDHNAARQHPEGQNPFNQSIIEQSEQEIPMISHIPEHFEVLKQEEMSEQSKIRRKLQRRLKNETKNIPKNFGKGIISFIEKNQKKIRSLLQQHRLSYNSFKIMVKSQKKIINTIADLRRLWTDETYGKCMRIISNLFFRRYSMNYIFNSRISNFSSHIKYRHSLWAALRNPYEFNHIKQY